MNLHSVEIKNFRSIRDEQIRLEPRCRVLVGINEAGKTNILKALSMLSDEVKPTSDDVRVPEPDEDIISEAYVRFVFTLERQERLELYDSISDKVVCVDKATPIVENEREKLSLPQLCDSVASVLYDVDLKLGQKRASYWRFPETQQAASGWYTPKKGSEPTTILKLRDETEVELSEFELIHSSAFEGEPTEDLTTADVKRIHALVGKAIIDYVLEKLPECILWRHSEEYLIPARIGFAAFVESPSVCLPLKHAFALAGIENIAEAVATARKQSNGTRNLLDRVGKRATQHIHDVWPEYKGISLDFRENGTTLETSVKDVHNLYDFSRRSDGFKRFIAFLLMISAPTNTRSMSNVLILSDDPDAGMHPSGARHVRDELIRISVDNYVVYATHSIFMIDRENIPRHLIVKKQDEVTLVEEANVSTFTDEEVLYNAMGFSMGEVLKPKNLIFEGWRDKKLFHTAMSRVPSQYKELKASLKEVGVCHVEGVKDVRRVAPILELAQRQCTIISDGDNVAREHQQEHKKKQIYGDWCRYDEILPEFGPLTGEDFVKPEHFVKVVESCRKTNPALVNLPPFVPTGDVGVLRELDRWVSRGGEVDADSKKTFVDQIKEATFNTLKQTHIRQEYYEFLKKLVSRV